MRDNYNYNNNGSSSILYKEKDTLNKMHKYEWKLKE